uniref:DNA methylase adenine-specific domain-containing protein n=1 Tax=Rhipilia penicilloides TaxID=1979422 RepID=A0A2P0QHN8_9CHLO|nr:hypothetical protein [Rhipilia penicilloides]ARO74283.1 hypothetical protein [Rhipilia penicilloides]
MSIDSLEALTRLQSLGKKFQKNNFDLILTNPPFGAAVKGAEKQYLQKYILGKNRSNQKTEILFIERCIEFLKPETGKMAIVLPDGILNNNSLQYVRDYILETCQILAVVSLPQTAFSHYGAEVKSSLFFVRKNKNEILRPTKLPYLYGHRGPWPKVEKRRRKTICLKFLNSTENSNKHKASLIGKIQSF